MLGHKNDLHPMLNKTKSNYLKTENINTNVHLQALQNQDKSNANNNDRQHIYPVFGSVELKITVIIFFGYLSMTGNFNFLICSSNLIKYGFKKKISMKMIKFSFFLTKYLLKMYYYFAVSKVNTNMKHFFYAHWYLLCCEQL